MIPSLTGGRPRVLVVKLSSLGDLFHPLPAVHAIKTALDVTVDWVTQPEYLDLVRCFTDVDRVITFPRRTAGRDGWAFRRELRLESYDLVLDFQGLLKSALIVKLARARRTIGPSWQREGAWLFYREVAGRRDKSRHAVEEAHDFVRHLDVPDAPPVFPVSFPPASIQASQPRVALAPFSRWPSKTWAALSFTDLVRELRERGEVSVFLLGGPADVATAADMERELKGQVVNLVGRLTLPEMGGYLQAMDLVVSNDSGLMHMAAAVGTPVLALFGPTDPKRTGPWGAGHQVLKSRLKCQPCFRRECPFKDASCLRAITPEMAARAAVRMLDRPAPQSVPAG